MKYCLEINGQIIEDENIHVLYNTIGFSQLPWIIYKSYQSKQSMIRLSAQTEMKIVDYEEMIFQMGNGVARRRLSKKYRIPYNMVQAIYKKTKVLNDVKSIGEMI